METQALLPAPPPAPEPPDYKFRWLVGIIAGLIILLLIFQLGVFVGFHKADFSYAWGENYHEVFGGPKGGVLRDLSGHDFINGHGTAGTIAKIDASDLVIEGSDGVEKTIQVTTATSIRSGAANLKISDLKLNESIVIIGSPQSDGSINAEIIRVFDPSSTPPSPAPFKFPFFN